MRHLTIIFYVFCLQLSLAYTSGSSVKVRYANSNWSFRQPPEGIISQVDQNLNYMTMAFENNREIEKNIDLTKYEAIQEIKRTLAENKDTPIELDITVIVPDVYEAITDLKINEDYSSSMISNSYIQGNLIENGGFESGSSEWDFLYSPLDVAPEDFSYNRIFELNSHPASGNRLLKMKFQGLGPKINAVRSKPFKIKPNTDYLLTYKYRGGVSGPNYKELRSCVSTAKGQNFKNEANEIGQEISDFPIGGHAQGPALFPNYYVEGDWTEYKHIFKTGRVSTHARIDLICIQENMILAGEVAFDDVIVTELNTVLPEEQAIPNFNLSEEKRVVHVLNPWESQIKPHIMGAYNNWDNQYLQNTPSAMKKYVSTEWYSYEFDNPIPGNFKIWRAGDKYQEYSPRQGIFDLGSTQGVDHYNFDKLFETHKQIWIIPSITSTQTPYVFTKIPKVRSLIDLSYDDDYIYLLNPWQSEGLEPRITFVEDNYLYPFDSQKSKMEQVNFCGLYRYKLTNQHSNQGFNFFVNESSDLGQVAGSLGFYEPELNPILHSDKTKPFIHVQTNSVTFFSSDYYFDDCGEISEDETLVPINIAKTDTRTYLNNSNRVIQSQTQDGDIDLITATTYDEIGRIKRQSLPIAMNLEEISGKHKFVDGVLDNTAPWENVESLVRKFYSTSSPWPDAGGFPYSETEYEKSALGRVLRSSQPGENFALNSDHYSQVIYTSNSNLNGGASTNETGNYFVKINKDPHGDPAGERANWSRGGWSREYTDKFGNTIKSVIPGSDESSDIVSTYKYDANGNMIQMTAPKGSNGDALVTTMEYDALGQLLSETLPDMNGSTEYRYDDMGRLRFTRTPEDIKKKRIQFNKYDEMGRVILTGIFVGDYADDVFDNEEKLNDSYWPESEDPGVKISVRNYYDSCQDIDDICSDIGELTTYLVSTPNAVNADVFEFADIKDAYIRLKTFYSNSNETPEEVKIYQLHSNGYNEFSPEIGEFTAILNSKGKKIPLVIESILKNSSEHLALVNDLNQELQYALNGVNLKGRLTKTKVYNYELNEVEPDNIIETTFKYDRRGNVIEQVEYNSMVSNLDEAYQRVSTDYDVVGKVLNRTWYKKNGTIPLHKEYYLYDHLGRNHKVIDQDGIVLHKSLFNALGQLIQECYGWDCQQPIAEGQYTNEKGVAVNFKYDLLGKLINRDFYVVKNELWFKDDYEELYYEQKPSTKPANYPVRFDGNIAFYKNSKNSKNFEYDHLKRLVQVESNVNSHNAKYSYYDNGQIKTLLRGNTALSSTATPSEYIYGAYKTRLKSIIGNPNGGSDSPYNLDNGKTFEYDDNGQLIENKAKSLQMAYNVNGLAYHFNISGTTDMYMAYQGGTRIGKYEYDNSELYKKTHYVLGGKEVRERLDVNSTSQIIPIAGGIGRLVFKNGTKKYEVYNRNYLGSTVGTYDLESLDKVYSTEYMPFGKQINEVVSNSGDDVTPKFTGKELDDVTGLNYFGARYYDSDIGLWTSVDPLRQFWSGYSYTGNGYNPVNAVDPDGNLVNRVQNSFKPNGRVLGVNKGEMTPFTSNQKQLGRGIFTTSAGLAGLFASVGTANPFGVVYSMSAISLGVMDIGLVVITSAMSSGNAPDLRQGRGPIALAGGAIGSMVGAEAELALFGTLGDLGMGASGILKNSSNLSEGVSQGLNAVALPMDVQTTGEHLNSVLED